MKIGDIITYIQPKDETPYNGHRDHPAMVTAVWGDECVNLKVFFDCGPVEDRTSVEPHGHYGGFFVPEPVVNTCSADTDKG
jgi:hypothetical protein